VVAHEAFDREAVGRVVGCVKFRCRREGEGEVGREVFVCVGLDRKSEVNNVRWSNRGNESNCVDDMGYGQSDGRRVR
jgi:hypothetical protein